MSAPIFAWRMRSRPSRSGVPGATAARASVERADAPRAIAPLYGRWRHGSGPRSRRPAHRPSARPSRPARASASTRRARPGATSMPAAPFGADARHDGPPEARAGPPRPAGAAVWRDLAQLAGQADLAAGHEVGAAPARRCATRRGPGPRPRSAPGSTSAHAARRPTRRRRASRTPTPARSLEHGEQQRQAGRRRGPGPTGGAVPSADGDTSACTSTSSGRCPSTIGTTTEPGDAGPPVGEEQPARVGDADQAAARSSRTARARRWSRSGA